MLGYSREELVTLRVQDVIVDDDVDAHYARFVNEQRERGTITLRRKDGSTFPYRYAAGKTNISALTYYVSFGLPDEPPSAPRRPRPCRARARARARRRRTRGRAAPAASAAT